MSSKEHCSKTIRHRFVCRSPARSVGVGGRRMGGKRQIDEELKWVPGWHTLHSTILKTPTRFWGGKIALAGTLVYFFPVMSSICFILIDGTLRRIHIIAKLRNCLPFMPGCPIDRCWRTSWQLRKGRLQKNGSKPTATQCVFGGGFKEHFWV